jgi:uncharacterized protein YecE (DUF72 family)
MAKLCIGCSGFSYRHWRGQFYPEELPQKEWFAHYGSVFSSVELNVTFYRLPSPEAFTRWYEQSAPDFTFALKGSRYITHLKRLLEIEEPLDRFFGPAQLLKEKLRVVLWQFPPDFKCAPDRLDNFLTLLQNYQVRSALEFRNQSWLCDEVVGLCKSRNTSLCMADRPEFIDSLPLTADFAYLRRHGAEGNYSGEYSKTQLAQDAARIRSYLSKNRDVFIYFNNDLAGAAPRNAVEFAKLLADDSEPKEARGKKV